MEDAALESEAELDAEQEALAPAPPAAATPNITPFGPARVNGHARLGEGTVTGPTPGQPLSGGVAFNGINLDRRDTPVQPVARFLSGSAGRGRYQDHRGNMVEGTGAEASVAEIGLGVRRGGTGVGLNLGVGNARAGTRTTDGLTERGRRANIVQGDVAAGFRAGGDYQYMRIGGAVGAGSARRFGLTDYDGNGRPELSMGIDAGYFSADVSSETLGRAYLWTQRRLQRLLGRPPTQ